MKKLDFSTLFLVSILMLPGCDSIRLDLDNLSRFKDELIGINEVDHSIFYTELDGKLNGLEIYRDDVLNDFTLSEVNCFKDTTKQALEDGRELEAKEYSKTYSIGKYDKTFSVYSCEDEYYYLYESSSMKRKYSGSNEYFLQDVDSTIHKVSKEKQLYAPYGTINTTTYNNRKNYLLNYFESKKDFIKEVINEKNNYGFTCYVDDNTFTLVFSEERKTAFSYSDNDGLEIVNGVHQYTITDNQFCCTIYIEREIIYKFDNYSEIEFRCSYEKVEIDFEDVLVREINLKDYSKTEYL